MVLAAVDQNHPGSLTEQVIAQASELFRWCDNAGPLGTSSLSVTGQT